MQSRFRGGGRSSRKAAGGAGAAAFNQSKTLSLLEIITRKAIRGIPSAGFMSAQQLAERYLNDERYLTEEELVDSLIFHESLKNSVQGFITGIGGLVTLPITVPSDIAGSWVIQARMVAAIATIYAKDPESEATQTGIFACMLGEQALKAFRDPAIKAAEKFTIKELSKLPPKTLTRINKTLGTRLVSEVGEKGAVSLGKWTPLVGGPISATIDFFFCYSMGLLAKRVFGPEEADLFNISQLSDVKDVVKNATRMAVKTTRDTITDKLEERRERKEVENLVKSLQAVLEFNQDIRGEAVRQRKEMLLARGPEVRECLIENAIKGNDRYRQVAREILVELCEPEDEVITRHLNSKDVATRLFVFSVLNGILTKKALPALEGETCTPQD